MTDASIIKEINRLRGMTVGQLREEWFRLYGEPTRSRNRDFLFRRLAWRVQEIALGGLSDRARGRIDELTPPGFERACTPAMQLPVDADPPSRPAPRTRRDPRLPVPGSVITRTWRGREYRLLVRDDGFEIDSRVHGSLSEAARAVTGQRWNGPLFWGLRERKR
jgi:hypothetical protein